MQFGLHVCRETDTWGIGAGIAWQRHWQIGLVAMAGKWTVLLGCVAPGWSTTR